MTSDPNDYSLMWRACFARFGPRLLLYARQWLPDLADAEDAVQEAFVRFWRKHRLPSDHHAGLLFAAVRSAALDHIRSETRRKTRENFASDDQLASTGGQSEAGWFVPTGTDQVPPVDAALKQLPSEQREVLVLKIWGELTFAQIAESLELSPNTVASRYRYALNALKKIIRPICYE